MEQITGRQIVRVGVDLAKRVIQVHAVDAAGRVVTRAGSDPRQVPALVHTTAVGVRGALLSR